MADDAAGRRPHRPPAARRGDTPGRGAASAADVGALLGELSELRLGLVTDLGLVAAAVEMDAEAVAIDVLDGRSHDLARFDARPTPHRGRVLLLAAPALATAAALAAVLLGVLPVGGSHGPTRPTTTAAASFDDLFLPHDATATGPPDVQAAALELHADITRIMAGAGSDPQAAMAALQQLAVAASAIDRTGRPTELDSVIAEAQRLITALQAQVAAVAVRATSVPALREPLPLPGPPAPGAVALPPPASSSAAIPTATPTDAVGTPPSPSPAPADPSWPFPSGTGGADSVPSPPH